MKFKSINFTCKNCGGPLRFSPIYNSLSCDFCDTKESIEKSYQEIKEYSFKEALTLLKKHHKEKIKKETTCNKCSATFTIAPYSISTNCPYCGTPVITKFVKEIESKSLLPFQVSQKKAQEFFKKWIGSLWFAPSKLKKFISGEYKLKGYYLPYWTYDSQTYTQYSGERGDIYYVDVERTVMVNGREERQIVRESRIAWTPVSGAVDNSFDDITVGASKTISHTILDNLEPWYTKILIPFNAKYLSGFDSEEYTIGLENGFEFAKVKMNRVISQTIRSKIGGDQQRINHMNTKYSNTTYKNVLFPVWTAEFKWNNKTYNYAINGQTGKVTGERPYSWIKITILIVTILLIIGGAVYLDNNPNILNIHFNRIF
ncbi:Primosomal protein N' (replication factor Y)-superfamily II helicase [hydrothermal vent metagenome]|uniref:Primosomal protein N' (Replication factor Y)-superfamily II helicase n=1 Tax=hydrothermal vent metagenome TaxID=652676 RepID=A0A1W1D0K6_9ZZZZ